MEPKTESMVWDIYKIKTDNFYLNESYSKQSDRVFFYDDRVQVKPYIIRVTERRYKLVLKWSLKAVDLLSQAPIFSIDCTHEGFFIPDGCKDNETIRFMIKFAQLEFAGELARRLRWTTLSDYDFTRVNYNSVADKIISTIASIN
ncbi:MAG: hypothetical protein ACTHLE_08555 [Agriterribacter sp.]